VVQNGSFHRDFNFINIYGILYDTSSSHSQDSYAGVSLIVIHCGLAFDGIFSTEGRKSSEAEAGDRDEDERDVDADEDEVDVAEHAGLVRRL